MNNNYSNYYQFIFQILTSAPSTLAKMEPHATMMIMKMDTHALAAQAGRAMIVEVGIYRHVIYIHL
jgi:hypothetical protein